MKRSKTQLLRSLAVVMLLGAGLASCSQDDIGDKQQGEPLPPGEYPLILNAGGLEAIATPAQQSAPSTRGTVEDNWLDAGDIAVQVDGGTPKKYEATNLSSDTKTAILKGIDKENTHYWQSSTAPINITAWCPYNYNPADGWKVKADQSTKEGYQASDLIKGELEVSFIEKDTKQLKFTHQTAKIVVKLESAGGVVFDANTQVMLLNVGGVEGEKPVITYRSDNTGNTYYALVNPQQLKANTQLIQVNTGGNSYIWTPDKDKDLSFGTAYTYTITVSNTGLTVKVDNGIAWGDDGATGSGSVDLDIVLDDSDRIFELSNNDEITVKGNGSPSKGKLTFNIPSGSTATVNLQEINIITYRDPNGEEYKLQNFINIVGGGKVIFNLIGKNTIELEGAVQFTDKNPGAIYTDGSEIVITGDGRLEITGDGDGGIVSNNGGNITIWETNIYMNYTGANTSKGACIGSWRQERCGNIVIFKSDVEINFISNIKFDDGEYSPAIGPAYDGYCGNVTITLKDDQTTKSDFLKKITITDKYSYSFPEDHKVVSATMTWIFDYQHGTITWLDSRENPITK